MLFEVHALPAGRFQAWFDQQVAEASVAAAAAPAPSVDPGSGQPARPGGRPSGGGGTPVDLELSPRTSRSTKALQAPANPPFTIHFDNQDAGTPHDVDDPRRERRHEGLQDNDLPGRRAKDYQEQALPAGTYKFECSIHPNMTGTLTVQ